MAINEARREREEDGLDLNNTDFFIWDYDKLQEYQRKLISIVASLESQIDRQSMRLQYYDLLTDFKDQVQVRKFTEIWDENWRKNVVFSLNRAKLFLAEVSRRMGVLEAAPGWRPPAGHC